jgi:hypothetical protein
MLQHFIQGVGQIIALDLIARVRSCHDGSYLAFDKKLFLPENLPSKIFDFFNKIGSPPTFAADVNLERPLSSA